MKDLSDHIYFAKHKQNKRPKIKEARSKTYIEDFGTPGPSPKKHVASFLVRYGIKGYKQGIQIPGFELHADLLFKTGFLVFVDPIGPDALTLSRLEEAGFFPIVIKTPKPTEEWFQAAATILGIARHELKPVYKSIFRRVAKLEEESK
jgi:hypothetical protein